MTSHQSTNRGFQILNPVKNSHLTVYWKAPNTTEPSPAVLLMHELNGMTHAFLDFAQRLVDQGFTVYLPLFFGKIGEPSSGIGSLVNSIRFGVKICLSREFHALCRLSEASPITHELRSLSNEIYQLRDHHIFPGIGAVGLCMTGGFVLSLLLEPAVQAPVAGHPALPLAICAKAKRDLGISAAELEQVKERIKETDLLLVRFEEDLLSPAQRQVRLEEECRPYLKTNVISWESRKQQKIKKRIPLQPHSVLAGEYRDQNRQAYDSTQKAFEAVINFLNHRLNPSLT